MDQLLDFLSSILWRMDESYRTMSAFAFLIIACALIVYALFHLYYELMTLYTQSISRKLNSLGYNCSVFYADERVIIVDNNNSHTFKVKLLLPFTFRKRLIKLCKEKLTYTV